ncbi:lipase family protein [Francisellaceae bacterium CB300]
MHFFRNIGLICVGSFIVLSTNASNININDLRIAVDLSNAVFCEEDYGKGCIESYNFLGRSKVPANVNLYTQNLPASQLVQSSSGIKDNIPKDSQLYPLIKSISNNKGSINDRNDPVQAFSIYDKDTNTAYIAIRGSVNLINWLIDATITSTKFGDDENVRVHLGFKLQLEATLKTPIIDRKTGKPVIDDKTGKEITLQSWIDAIRNEHNPDFVVTGLSLGGATSMLLGATLLDQGVSPDNLKVITFGQPAVGLWGFVSKYQPQLQDSYMMVRNIGDPNKSFDSFYPSSIGDPIVVSTSPFTYRHFANQLVISEDRFHYFVDTLPSYIPEQFKYLLSLHNRTNYADFICSCNPLKERCDSRLRNDNDLSMDKISCKLES